MKNNAHIFFEGIAWPHFMLELRMDDDQHDPDKMMMTMMPTMTMMISDNNDDNNDNNDNSNSKQ